MHGCWFRLSCSQLAWLMRTMAAASTPHPTLPGGWLVRDGPGQDGSTCCSMHFLMVSRRGFTWLRLYWHLGQNCDKVISDTFYCSEQATSHPDTRAREIYLIGEDANSHCRESQTQGRKKLWPFLQSAVARHRLSSALIDVIIYYCPR